ncbi:septal ring lytic transglycosylase RlpA family protein [Lichenicoccus sp.]|uniref:septal ring lytic transglycosylase RlpA family protein n=1 Tax=Lichenicoccus sp. TaxID=2781899 RepID=UPI003D1498BD
MRGTILAALLLTAPALGGCHHRPPPRSLPARYTLGAPWQGAGCWFYPAETLSYDATGIAAIDPAERRPGLTADGEAYDPRALAGAHQTLQLPVIVRVENLENGRTIALRLNDRGPAQPGRLLSLTPHAAAELGMAGLPRRVRVRLDMPASARLLQQVQGAPPPDVIAAPLADVAEQSLMPGAPPAAPAAEAARHDDAPASGTSGLTRTLPDQGADPGQLWIDAGQFSGRRYADRVAATTGGFVRQQGVGRSTIFMVRIGPLPTIAAADAALDQALTAGVTGARIVVE